MSCVDKASVLYIERLFSFIHTYVDATVSFEQPEYIIDENASLVLPMLRISSPLSYRLDVRVLATDITANGKHHL